MRTFLIQNENARQAIAIVIHEGYECPTFVSDQDGPVPTVLVSTYKAGDLYRLKVTLDDKPKIEVVSVEREA